MRTWLKVCKRCARVSDLARRLEVNKREGYRGAGSGEEWELGVGKR